MKIEYRVRPLTRYIVTRFEEGEHQCGSTSHGEFANEAGAYDVAYALCKAEHDSLGWPPGDERIQYPITPNGAPDFSRFSTVVDPKDAAPQPA